MNNTNQTNAVLNNINKRSIPIIIVRCNNCYSIYEEQDFNIIDCSKCKTDKYLMDIETINQELTND